ncbi:hypothetical protein EJ07DRAFT_151933 [Lizonia empirigonia]|nr:hypothetical protein EJ07DRAFT_151933 [Lizonia empirigonia]
MASLCVSNLTQLFESLGFTTSYPPTPQPQPACDLTHIPYSSWRPPTCTQKCPGPCAHGADTRVDELVTKPSPSQRPAHEADVVTNAQAQCAVASAKTTTSSETSRRGKRPEVLTVQTRSSQGCSYTEARGQGRPETHCGLDPQIPKSLGSASGETTPDLTSLFTHDDAYKEYKAHAVAAADVDADAHADTHTAPPAQHIIPPAAQHKHNTSTSAAVVVAPALQPASP